MRSTARSLSIVFSKPVKLKKDDLATRAISSVKDNINTERNSKVQEKFGPVSEKVLVGLNVIDKKKKTTNLLD